MDTLALLSILISLTGLVSWDVLVSGPAEVTPDLR